MHPTVVSVKLFIIRDEFTWQTFLQRKRYIIYVYVSFENGNYHVVYFYVGLYGN